MTAQEKRSVRSRVRAENPSGACGNVDHMTIDELKARAVDESFDGSCPACGMFHKITIFDILLPRVLAGEEITRAEIARMGHGGLCSNCKVCSYPVCHFGK